MTQTALFDVLREIGTRKLTRQDLVLDISLAMSLILGYVILPFYPSPVMTLLRECADKQVFLDCVQVFSETSLLYCGSSDAVDWWHQW